MIQKDGVFSRKLENLVSYIEENLRASKTSGIKFVDPRDLKQKLLRRQNHVIFGRRGSGKSTLLRSIDITTLMMPIYINLEDFKDITFPNIILHILDVSFKSLRQVLKKEFPLYKFYQMKFRQFTFRKKLKKEIKKTKLLIHSPDEGEQERKVISMKEGEAGASLKSSFLGKFTFWKKTEVAEKIPINKLNELRLNLTQYKKIFNQMSSYCDNKSIFLEFDDFYFVSKKMQSQLT